VCFFRLGTELLELIVVIYGGFVQPAISLQDVFHKEAIRIFSLLSILIFLNITCMEKALFMALNLVTAINYSYAILRYST
jgi:hypothetical protein